MLRNGNGLDLARQARVHSLRLHVLLMTGETEGANPAGLTARQHGEVDDYLVITAFDSTSAGSTDSLNVTNVGDTSPGCPSTATTPAPTPIEQGGYIKITL